MNEYSNLIVAGSNSSIAKLVVPLLDLPVENQFALSRSNNFPSWADNSHVKKLVVDYFGDDLFEAISHSSNEINYGATLILNFTGNFGVVASAPLFKKNDVLSTIQANIIPFLSTVELLRRCAPGSMLISFAGAGIGGNNLDDSSLGYLAAKASIVLLTESLNSQLSSSNLYLAAISPGPYPSEMQNLVALSPDAGIPKSRKMRASQVEVNTERLAKLAEVLKVVAQNPRKSGGAVWSAVHDLDLLKNSELQSDFGTLRRVIQ